MNKGGIGVGSASIVLVFAVLCLTIFSLITLVVGRNNYTIAEAEVNLVVGYYEADTLAEYVLAQILEAGSIPDSIYGVEVDSGWDQGLEMSVASYICPISDNKELYVKLAIDGDSVDIISWQMVDAGEWMLDDSLGVWIGEVVFGDITDIWLDE